MAKGSKMQKLGENLAKVAGTFSSPATTDKPTKVVSRGNGCATKGLTHNKSD